MGGIGIYGEYPHGLQSLPDGETSPASAPAGATTCIGGRRARAPIDALRDTGPWLRPANAEPPLCGQTSRYDAKHREPMAIWMEWFRGPVTTAYLQCATRVQKLSRAATFSARLRNRRGDPPRPPRSFCLGLPNPLGSSRNMPDGEITLILHRLEHGDTPAAAELLPLVYDELRRLAAAKMARESAGQTLQPTALVHEVWLRLGGDPEKTWANRAHFFAAAAESMRRILIDRARRKRALHRGGGLERIETDAEHLDIAAPTEDDEELLLASEALDALHAIDPRKAELVKHKYFLGLTLEDAADLLGISPSTAHREWAYARSWLYAEVKRLRA